jgi:hypothetical protein
LRSLLLFSLIEVEYYAASLALTGLIGVCAACMSETFLNTCDCSRSSRSSHLFLIGSPRALVNPRHAHPRTAPLTTQAYAPIQYVEHAQP